MLQRWIWVACFFVSSFDVMGLAPSMARGQSASHAELQVKLERASTGDLAVRPLGGGEWRLLESGDDVPDAHELRTSATGVVQLEWAKGRLALNPNSQVQLRLSQGSLTLDQGHAAMWLKQGSAAWTFIGNGLKLEVAGGSEVDVEADAHSVSGRVLNGEVRVHHETSQTSISNGKQWSWVASKLKVDDIPAKDLESSKSMSLMQSRKALRRAQSKDAATGLTPQLHIARYHVNVVIEPPLAHVQIDQTFYSPFSRSAEGTFHFQLPEQAAIQRFAMYTVPDRLVEGEVIERRQARQIYNSIVRGFKDPAILEQISPTSYRMQIFPILARDTKRVLLDITMPLTDLPDRWRSFRLPLLEDAEPVWDFQIKGTIRGGLQAPSVNSPTHGRDKGWKVATLPDETTEFHLSSTDYESKREFLLKFQLPEEEPGSLRVRETFADNDTYFLATIPPDEVMSDKAAQSLLAAQKASGVDVLILADTSSSMARWRQQQRRVIDNVLSNLRPEDRFRIAAVDVELRTASEEWNHAKPQHKQTALQWLDRELYLGGSHYEVTLNAAMHQFGKARGRRCFVMYVGDGCRDPRITAQTMPVDRPAPADQLVPAFVNLAAVMVGDPRDSMGFIESYVRSHGGIVFRGDPSGLREQFRWSLASMTQSLKVEFDQKQDRSRFELEWPRRWTPGTPLRVWGRQSKGDAITVSGRVMGADGEPLGSDSKTLATFKRHWPIAEAEQHQAVATCCVHRLLQQLHVEWKFPAPGRDPTEFDNESVRLSRFWSVLGPKTGFLVLEKEEDYAQRGLTITRDRPLWIPKASIVADRKNGTVEVGEALARRRHEVDDEAIAPAIAELVTETQQALRAGTPKVARAAIEQLRKIKPARPEVTQTLDRVDEVLATQALSRIAPQELGTQRDYFTRGALGQRPQLARGRDLGVLPYETFRRQLFPAWAEKRVKPPKFVDVPLSDAYQAIGELAGVSIQMDQAALDSIGVASDASVNLDLKGPLPIHSLMEIINRPLNLTWLVMGNVPLITSVDESANRLMAIRYPVADLVDPSVPLLSDQLHLPTLDDEQQHLERVQVKLRSRFDIDVNDVPLSKVMDWISEKQNEPIVLNHAAMDAAGVADPEITLTLKDAPLESVIRQVLKPTGLTYLVKDHVIWITTVDEEANRLELRLHSTRGMNVPAPLGLGGVERAPREVLGGGGFGGGGLGGGGFGGGGAFGGGGGLGGGAAPGAVPQAEPRSPLFESQPPRADEPSKTSAVKSSEAPADDDEPHIVTPIYSHDSISQFLMETTSGGWEVDGSGSGTIASPPLINALLVFQTQFVQQEIEEGMQELRLINQSSRRRSGQPSIEGSLQRPDKDWAPDQLINCLMQATGGGWEMDGSGTGSWHFDAKTQSLQIRQTFGVHREIVRFLTLLRRARYRDLYGQDWHPESPLVGSHLPLSELLQSDFRHVAPPKQFLRLDPQLVKSIPARRDPAHGRLTTWRHSRETEAAPQDPAADRASNALLSGPPFVTYLTQPGALECWQGDRIVRVEQERAAVLDPLTQLVTIGPWGRDVRQRLDQRLPWLPHLTNRELLEHYDVLLMSEDPQSVLLKLIPQAATRSQVARCEVRFSKEHGLPLTWDIYYCDELTLRLKFSDLSEDKEPHWQRVIGEDAQGRVLERWEVAERRPVQSAARASAEHLASGFSILHDPTMVSRANQVSPAGIIPTTKAYLAALKYLPTATGDSAIEPNRLPLRNHWSRCIVLNLEPQANNEVSLSSPVLRALEAVDAEDWDAAVTELSVAQQRWPGHGLLRVLEAWCRAQMDRVAAENRAANRVSSRTDKVNVRTQHARVLQLLRSVANSPSVVLLERILLSKFAANMDAVEDRYNAVVRQPWYEELPPNAIGFGLDVVELYDLFDRQLESERTWRDALRLSYLASLRGQADVALKHLESAQRLLNGRRLPGIWYELRMHALLRADRFEDARSLGNGALEDASLSPEVLVTLSEELRRADHLKLSNQLTQAALDRAKAEVKGPGAYRARLLRRLANSQTDAARWKQLLAAIEIADEDISLQQSIWGELSTELRIDAELADLTELSKLAQTESLKIEFQRLIALHHEDRRDDVGTFNVLSSLHRSGLLAVDDETRLFDLCVREGKYEEARQMLVLEMSRPKPDLLRFVRRADYWPVEFRGLQLRIETTHDDRPLFRASDRHSFPPGPMPGGGFF